jgi:UDPglucose 6-dehydrogenase
VAEIVIVGTGYVGLTTGVCLAEIGHTVCCIDHDLQKITRLQTGECVIYEPGLEELLRKNLADGRIRFEIDARAGLNKANVVFLCLPTPDREDGSVDTSAIDNFLIKNRENLPRASVLVNKSTAPVGSVERIRVSIARDDIQVVSNPEFLREGSAVEDFLRPSRVVIGADEHDASEVVSDIYRALECPIIVTDPRTAELIKYASNAFLATKIAFINSIANLCESLDADVRVVADAMGRDPRIGKEFLRAGPGYGGSCFPKDTLGLLHTAEQANYEFGILRSVVASNLRQTSHVVERVHRILGSHGSRARVAVWGLTFKANTDDLRHSPALAVVEGLEKSGFVVHAYDPTVYVNPPQLTSTVVYRSALDVVKEADLLLILTDWPEFSMIDPKTVYDIMSAPCVYDTRNCLDSKEWLDVGFQVHATGVNFHLPKK